MNVDESCGSVNTKMDKAPHRGEREEKIVFTVGMRRRRVSTCCLLLAERQSLAMKIINILTRHFVFHESVRKATCVDILLSPSARFAEAESLS
jgi:hypothetical protein